ALSQQTRRLYRSRFAPGTFLFQRAAPDAPFAQELSNDEQARRWDAWRQTFQALWKQLQQEIRTSTLLSLENLWREAGLNAAVLYATRWDERLQQSVLRLKKAQDDLAQRRQSSQEQEVAWQDKHKKPIPAHAALEADHPESETDGERPAKNQDEQRDQRSQRVQLGLICLIMGAAFSFVSWMLYSELGGQPNLLLVLIVLCCFAGMFAANWFYTRRAWPQSPTRLRRAQIHFTRKQWMERCLQESYEQRLELAVQLQERVKGVTSTLLMQIARDLHKQARQTLEEAILQPTGGRNFLCGNARHFPTANEAEIAFLETTRAQSIFSRLNITDSEKADLRRAYEDAIRAFFLRDEQSSCEQSLQSLLCYEARTQIDPLFRFEQTSDGSVSQGKPTRDFSKRHLSQKDFSLDISSEFLESVLQRALLPSLWRGQTGNRAPSTFFCTTPVRIQENQTKFDGPVTAVTTIYAKDKGIQLELTTGWMLLCALYCEQPPETTELFSDQR
ncbi:MAG TPA: hypothetical protein VN729_09135, partial [Ktedonobacteraceae bacterium]|nr:hypothetical protein [Ktedonobacteraceae bacterium]